jgi:hypothetical protein
MEQSWNGRLTRACQCVWRKAKSLKQKAESKEHIEAESLKQAKGRWKKAESKEHIEAESLKLKAKESQHYFASLLISHRSPCSPFTSHHSPFTFTLHLHPSRFTIHVPPARHYSSTTASSGLPVENTASLFSTGFFGSFFSAAS